jgi:dienelactone hydrolase
MAASIVTIVLLLLAVFVALTLDSDFDRIEVTNVSIEDDDIELSGLLYRPKSAGAQKPAPAVVIAHGISGSKEMMSSIGLELARRGFVSLCLDLYGHSESQGSLEDGRVDPSFGVYSAVQYLKSQPYVDSSSLALVGHSLGAGAARATVAKETQIGATILVGGGLGENAEDPEYGVFNSTFPKNLLVIVGKYDVLFDMKELTSEQLSPIFGTQDEVVPDVLYGDFETQTARKLITPSTTHLLEIADPIAISEIVSWTEGSLGKNQNPAAPLSSGLIYGQREVVVLLALIALVGTAMLSFFLTDKLFHIRNGKESPAKEETHPHQWRIYALWAIVNLVLLFPMFGVGYVVQFPPLVFGASIAWWLMVSGLVGLFIITKFSRRITGKALSLKQTLRNHFSKKEAIGAIMSFALVLTVVTVLGLNFDFTFRIISPLLRDFSSARRVLAFFAFTPFFFAYFLSEGLFLHDLPQHNPYSPKTRQEIRNYAETVIGKILPYVVLIAIHYSSKILFDVWIFPSFVGFLMEFLMLIIPIFLITTSISWWFYRRTQRVGYGTLLNTLLMSWVASVIFPF